ncbi:MAG TPA: class I SAM-dependent methyltransferase [Roseiflexaceae bacterium]|nr:class I SAM-dependent methyltransferase [Roseiflexaceae bacterium]
MSIFVTFGIGYGTVLLACIYSWFHAGILAHRYAQTVGLPQRDGLFGLDTDLYDRSFKEHALGVLAKDSSRTTKIVSLGLDNTLRARLVERMHLAPGMVVCNLMTGGGEMWPHLVPLIARGGSITAVDFTPEMLALAQQRLGRMSARPVITLHQADACATGLPDDHFDAVVCAFGLATLTSTQFDELLQEILRILRPGGIFGFVELSRPAERRRQRWFDSYLAGVAPALSELLGGHLGGTLLLREYLTRFDNGQLLLPSFYKHRCIFYRYEFFGGCATAIVGMKDSA